MANEMNCLLKSDFRFESEKLILLKLSVLVPLNSHYESHPLTSFVKIIVNHISTRAEELLFWFLSDSYLNHSSLLQHSLTHHKSPFCRPQAKAIKQLIKVFFLRPL